MQGPAPVSNSAARVSHAVSNPTIGAAFEQTAARYPDRLFLSDGQQSSSFAQSLQQVDAIAAALLARGLVRHDRLALWLPNSPQWVLVALACARLGILIVTVNTRNKAEETGYILKKSRAKALVMVDRYFGIDYCELLSSTLPAFSGTARELTPNDTLPDLQCVIVLRGAVAGFDLDSRLLGPTVPRETLNAALRAVEVSDPAVTVFTSGTTGFPKGAVHSHRLLRNCSNIARCLHIEPGDVILGHMPFYHIAGLCTEMFPAAMLGCTLLTVAHWQPDSVAHLINLHKVNIFGGIPTHFIDLCDAVDASKTDTSCLKSAWIGGATVTPDVASRAKRVLRLTALQSVYGMTETTSSTVLSDFDDPIEIVCDNKGKPIGDFEVTVVDPETGTPRPIGADGEVWVRGHLVMDGYLDDAAATSAVMTPEGWFKTGDIGHFDAAGYLKITARLKDMFIVGGTNAYPAEIERCLQGMRGIRQAIVVGVPERRLGEVGFAFVQREQAADITAAQVMEFAKRHLANYKVPRHVHFVDQFPVTSTNKIQRHVLVKEARELLRETTVNA